MSDNEFLLDLAYDALSAKLEDALSNEKDSEKTKKALNTIVGSDHVKAVIDAKKLRRRKNESNESLANRAHRLYNARQEINKDWSKYKGKEITISLESIKKYLKLNSYSAPEGKLVIGIRGAYPKANEETSVPSKSVTLQLRYIDFTRVNCTILIADFTEKNKPLIAFPSNTVPNAKYFNDPHNIMIPGYYFEKHKLGVHHGDHFRLQNSWYSKYIYKRSNVLCKTSQKRKDSLMLGQPADEIHQTYGIYAKSGTESAGCQTILGRNVKAIPDWEPNSWLGPWDGNAYNKELKDRDRRALSDPYGIFLKNLFPDKQSTKGMPDYLLIDGKDFYNLTHSSNKYIRYNINSFDQIDHNKNTDTILLLNNILAEIVDLDFVSERLNWVFCTSNHKLIDPSTNINITSPDQPEVKNIPQKLRRIKNLSTGHVYSISSYLYVCAIQIELKFRKLDGIMTKELYDEIIQMFPEKKVVLDALNEWPKLT